MKRRSIVTYLVSGDQDICPCHELLRRTSRYRGRRVRHDAEVSETAADEMISGRSYVVIAHGSKDGTVKWFRSDTGSAARWLWVGMRRPPRGARVYLYSCYAGRKLPHFLRYCECFGHTDVVPMPRGGGKDAVLAFLDQVDRVLRDSPYDAEVWRVRLGAYVNAAFVKAVENPSPLGNALPLFILRKSLGFVDA
jgi:hypothetical protein